MMTELAAAIEKVLADVDVVLGWERNPVTGAARPAWFYSAEDAERAVFDATCAHNLAVYLPRLKGQKVGIVVKTCDSRAVVQLMAEGEVDRDRVKVIGVACGEGGILDMKTIWRRHGFGAAVEADGGSLSITGEQVDMDEYLLAKCRSCAGGEPAVCDEHVGTAAAGQGMAAAGENPEDAMSEAEREFAAMSPAQRRQFWQEQFSRCIRCYACREACPMCFCRDVCAIQSSEPRWARGGIDARNAQMAQLVRVSHLAGRCTGCGECERACPVGIPLMLLMNEQNRIIEEMFEGYRAGTDPEARPPLLTFDINADSWGEA